MAETVLEDTFTLQWLPGDYKQILDHSVVTSSRTLDSVSSFGNIIGQLWTLDLGNW